MDHNIGQKFHKSAARITLSMMFENLRRDARVFGFGWAKGWMGWWRRARHSSSEKPTIAEQLNPSVDAVFLAGRREKPCNDYVLFIFIIISYFI